MWESCRHVWESCGYPLRAGQSLWSPYEVLAPAVQLQMLEAAATAIDRIESKSLSPPGEQSQLFQQELQTEFTNGLSAVDQKEPSNHWQKAIKSLNEAIVEARHNPETARALFALASIGIGRRDHDALERLSITFSREGIPLEFLSHYVPDESFSYLSMNDGLNDRF